MRERLRGEIETPDAARREADARLAEVRAALSVAAATQPKPQHQQIMRSIFEAALALSARDQG